MMKIIFSFLLVFFVIASPSYAQYKVVEESGKRPAWVSGLQGGFVIGLGTDMEMDKARDKAMNNVREQITESVAVHVSSIAEDAVKEVMAGDESWFSSSFERNTQTETAQHDYLKGISPSRIDEVYWEKRNHKKDNTLEYFYAVKYPFNQLDLQELVAEFEKKDAELTKLLERQISLSENFKTIEELEQCISSLEKITPVFRDNRKEKAEVTLEKCRSLLDAVYLKEEQSEPGVLRYALYVGKKRVSTAKKPMVQSNCAIINNTNLGSSTVAITYDAENCYDEPGNHIHVIYSIYRGKVDKEFSFGSEAIDFELAIIGDLHCYAGENKLAFTIRNMHDHPVLLEKIELDCELGWQFSAESGETITSAGNHKVNLKCHKPPAAETRNDLVSGYLHYSSQKTGEQKSLRIYKKKLNVVR